MDRGQLVAIGRIRRSLPRGFWEISFKGDGLAILPLPVAIWLYRSAQAPAASPPVFAGSGRGKSRCREESHCSEEQGNKGQFWQARLLEAGPRNERRRIARMRLELLGAPPEGESLELSRCWIMASQSSLLAAADATLLFELIGRPIYCQGSRVAVVAGCFETAANTVLVAALPNGKELFLPLVDEYVDLDSSAERVEVDRFFEFT